MNTKRLDIRSFKDKFRTTRDVRISKEKLNYAKALEQNFSTQIFRISKVVYTLHAYLIPEKIIL